MLLSFDLATKTGWARGEPGSVPEHGTYVLPSTGSDYGWWGLHADAFFRQMLQTGNVTNVVYESPILRGTTQITTLRKLYSLGTILEMACRDHDIPCFEAQMQTVRSFFVPGGCPAKNPKPHVVAQCIALGWNPKDDNAADALATWAWGCHQLELDKEPDLLRG